MITRVNISFFRYHSRETETGEAPLIAGYGMRTREKFSPLGSRLQETSGTRTSKWQQESLLSPPYICHDISHITLNLFFQFH